MKNLRSSIRGSLCGGLAFLAMLCLAEVANGTTLQRQGMESLVASHGTIVIAQVVDASSYWNADGSMILTDVQLKADQFLKGHNEAGELTVTLLGGTVGDLSTLILGGAELALGNTYLLFLNEENLLPGLSSLTVREHSQGAFDIVDGPRGELRAISQAGHEALVPDAAGESLAPGGAEGLVLQEALESIDALKNRGGER